MKNSKMHVVFVLANNSEAPYFSWFAKRSKSDPNVQMSFVCMYKEKPKMVKEMYKYGCDCHHIFYNDQQRKMGLVKAFIKLYFLFKRIKPDVVNSHLFDDSLPSLLAAKLAKVPIRVITKGDTGFHYLYAKKWIIFDRFNNRNSTHIIAISEQNKALIIKVEKPALTKLSMIHHGIPIKELSVQNDQTKADFIKKYDLKGFKVIGNISRLIQWKGQELIINAAEQLVKERSNIKFLLIGEGPDEIRLKHLIKSKSLEQHVILTGWVDRNLIPSLYGIMDIYCHTATNEPFGFVLAEALANGLPLISSKTGVAADLIKNGHNGYLFPEGNVKELISALNQILNQDIEDISINAKKTAEKKLDFEIMYNNYIKLYQNN